MDNEVVIHVRADDDTHTGFDKARVGAKKTASDLEGEFRRVAPKLGEEVGGGILSGLKNVGPALKTASEGVGSQMGPIIAGGLALASPLIAATISAAIIGGASVGAAGIGVALAAQDANVKGAAAALGKSLMGSLVADAGVFVGPVLKQIDKIQSAFAKLNPVISHIFANASKFLDPLVDGALRGVSSILHGIDALVANGGPVIEQLGKSVEDLGRHFGHALEVISGGGEESAQALQDITKNLGTIIDATAYLIRGLTEVYGWFHKIGVTGQLFLGPIGAFADLYNNIKNVGKKSKETKTDTDDLATAMHGAADAAKDQKSALQDLADEMKSETDPLFALIRGQKDVAEAQKNYNDALKKHGPRSAEAKDAMAELGEKAFALNSKVSAAAGGFNGRLTPAMITALRNAGLTKGQIKALEGQLRSAAAAADDWAGTYTQRYNVVYSVSGSERLDPTGHRIGGYKASGGVVGAASGATRSGLTMVGEYGPELLNLPPGTQVHSNPDTQRMMSPGGSGGGQLLVSVDASKANALWRAILEALRLEIRAQGGNVQQVLGVAGR